jgi:hypothetical protein
MSVEMHEAAHAVAAILLDREVSFVEVGWKATARGEQLGHCRVPIGDQLPVSQLALCLAGYLGEGAPDWPPPWPEALDERREGLGKVLRLLDVDEPSYCAAVEHTEAIIAHPQFKTLQSSIARALAAVPRIEAPEIEALVDAHLSEKGDRAWST